MGISQESTSEDNNLKKLKTNAGIVRKMSVRTSDLFKASIQVNHKSLKGNNTAVSLV